MNILFKSVQIVDGTGRIPFKSDVLVKNNRIAAVGNFPNFRADETINSSGAYLAPGFIDLHTTSDRYLSLFTNPIQKDYLLQGVTSILGGQCGSSLSPLIYGSLETIREWADIVGINLNWHSTKEFFEALKNKRFGVNFLTLTGHNTIRQAVIGEKYREANKNEMAVIMAQVEKSIKEGSFGVSVGLGYGEMRDVSYSEIKNLAEVASKQKVLYAIHLRNEKREMVSAVEEVIDLAKETSAKIMISHLRPFMGFSKEYDEAISLIDKNLTKAEVYFNVSPTNVSSGLVQSLLPNWLASANKEEILKDIETPGLREKILRELPRMGGEEIIIINAPKNKYLVGKTLKEFSENRDIPVGQGILELMKLTQLRATVLCKNLQIRRATSILLHERAIVASNSASFEEEETEKRFTEFKKPLAFHKTLELVDKQKLMPIETAVYKMSGLPAKILGLNNRGVIKQGNFADLVMFRGSEIMEVMVNGRRVVKAGKAEDTLEGKILRK